MSSEDQFPLVAHCRPTLDDRFSFRSDEDPIIIDPSTKPDEQLSSIIAKEPWYEKPLVVVVVGASGDLAKKKTYPSLFELYQHGLLPPQTQIWGYARTPKTHMELRDHLHPHLTTGQLPAKIMGGNYSLKNFLELCYYHNGDSYGDVDAYTKMLSEISDTAPFDAANANVLYYLAIPPSAFQDTVQTLEAIPSAMVKGRTRIVIEKPFGKDTQSCKDLLDSFGDLEEEMQYRVDHYLAKPMVENLSTLRSANPWIENMMSKDHVESVHIRFKEPFGTQGRGGYFDQYNIIRDVLQNHLLQVLLLVAMDVPTPSTSEDDEDDDSFRLAKLAVLENMPSIALEDALLGQYDGYSDDPTIKNKDTNCPTYAALRCFVNNERWKGVPFILEAGKALDERIVDVQVNLKARAPFPGNTLTMEVQPQPRVSMTAHMKPVDSAATESVITTTLSTNYSVENSKDKPPIIENAYSRLLLDVLRGHQNNFVRADELVRSWEIFTPLLHQIERDNIQPVMYKYGSNGPASRAVFLEEMIPSQEQQPILKSSL